ncbi:MAG: magnesium chelatase [Planctomycetota bacterium]|nr:MAG: magnesium chelatase [Planctomycetota bacterium]
MNEQVELLTKKITEAKIEISKIIIGQERAIELCLMAIFAGQHVLLEGVPGLAKTLLVKTLAHTLGCDFGRIQFSPDLMPSDITGTNIYNLKLNEFKLLKGPIFKTFILADEINRAPAKTQSALLQAMQEKEVTIDNETLTLDQNFTVFATQNPIEFEGTYPLPEAQKDRFMMKVYLDYPELDEELIFAKKVLTGENPEDTLKKNIVNSVLHAEDLHNFREGLLNISMNDELIKYAVDIVRATRSNDSILVGAGPRATQSLIYGSRIQALFNERDFVIPDDIQEMVLSVLSHRIIIRPEYEMEGVTSKDALDQVIKMVSVPK